MKFNVEHIFKHKFIGEVRISPTDQSCRGVTHGACDEKDDTSRFLRVKEWKSVRRTEHLISE